MCNNLCSHAHTYIRQHIHKEYTYLFYNDGSHLHLYMKYLVHNNRTFNIEGTMIFNISLNQLFRYNNKISDIHAANLSRFQITLNV